MRYFPDKQTKTLAKTLSLTAKSQKATHGHYCIQYSEEVNSLADVHGLAWTGLWMDVQDADGKDAVAEKEINLWSELWKVPVELKQKINIVDVQPSAGVLVKVGAGEALVSTSSFQDPPGLLSTADLDPCEL